MYITNDQFAILEKIYGMLPTGEDFKKLPEAEQEAIVNYDIVLCELTKKRKQANAKTAAYIAEKRKTNKNYAR